MSRTPRQKGKCSCGGTRRAKARLTRDEAEQEATALNTVPDGWARLEAYYCAYCTMWHVGHGRER